ALAVVVIGHNTAGVALTVIEGLNLTGFVRPEDLATLLAAAVIGLLWIRARIGRDLRREAMAHGVWIGIGILALTMIWGVATLVGGGAVPLLRLGVPTTTVTGWPLVDAAIAWVLGFAVTLPTVGGGEALARAAHEFQPPRVEALKRTRFLTVVFA